MLVWIRADGNEEIASGHLRRTLTIAEALRQQGAEVIFLLANEESRDVFLQLTDGNRAGWSYLLLGCPYGDREKDLRRMSELFGAGAPDWLIVDSYAAMPEYFVQLKEMAAARVASAASADSPGAGGKAASAAAAGGPAGAKERNVSPAASAAQGSVCRIACLDDLMAFDPPVDLVINYAPDVTAAEAFYHHASVRLLGPAYAPLRSQFSGMEPKVREQVFRILITTGGSDPFGMSDAAAQAVRRAWSGEGEAQSDAARRSCLRIADAPWSGAGEEQSDAGQVRKPGERPEQASGREMTGRGYAAAGAAHPQAELVFAGPGHPYISNMAAMLAKCDLAVSAGGTTLYELCAAGIPTVAFSMAENQQIFAKKMAAAGACTYAGDVRDPKEREEVLRRITGWVRKHCGCDDETGAGAAAGLALRQRESARMHAITDGRGADRIAQALMESGQKHTDF